MSALEALPSQSSATVASLPARDTAHGLYERHSNRILGFCLRRLDTREEAEDAVQTVFINALRALQRGVVPVCEEAWLFKIAENVCHETHRANGRRRQREVAQPENLPDPVSHEPELGNDVAKELVNALGGLPVNQRRALLLREWRGLSYREIATELRCSVGAVETLIFRARRNMAQALSQTKSRIAGVLDLGSLAGALKTMFGGATVAKVAAAAAVVTVATLPAGDAPQATASKRAAVVPKRVTLMPPARTDLVKRAIAPTAVSGIRADKQPVGSKRDRAVRSRPREAAPGAPSRSQPDQSERATGAPSPGASTVQGAPVITPPAIQVPPTPVIELPQVPELPELPVQAPTEIQVPELPVPPGLPVQLPQEIQVPQLP